MPKVKLNLPSFRALRTSPEVEADLAERAARIAAAAGEGFVVADGESGRNRARAAVVAATPGARAKNARENTLLHALDAGRS